MRRSMVISLALVLVIVMVAPVLAQTSATPATKTEQPPLKPEDVKQLREAAQAISDLLAGKKPASEVPAKKEEPQQNMADVADRALSILSGYISSAEQAFKKVAPEVWRIMIRQQYANAIAGPLIPLALIGFITAFVVIVKRWWPEAKLPEHATADERSEYNDDWWGRFWVTNIIPGVLYFVFGIWASISIASSAQMFINPEYYAFRDLLNIVLQKGSL